MSRSPIATLAEPVGLKRLMNALKRWRLSDGAVVLGWGITSLFAVYSALLRCHSSAPTPSSGVVESRKYQHKIPAA